MKKTTTIYRSKKFGTENIDWTRQDGGCICYKCCVTCSKTVECCNTTNKSSTIEECCVKS